MTLSIRHSSGLVLLSYALMLGPAQADSRVTHVYAGTWQANDFQELENPGCSIGSDGNTPGTRLIMGLSRHRPNPANLLLRKLGWTIPAGLEIRVVAQFPDNVSMTLTGTGSGQAIQIDLGPAQLGTWTHELTASDKLRLTFDGTEPDWIFDLTGTTAVVNAMGDCIHEHQIIGAAPPFAAAIAAEPNSPPSAPYNFQPTQPSSVTTSPMTGDAGVINPNPPSAAIASHSETSDPRKTEFNFIALLKTGQEAYKSAPNALSQAVARVDRAQALCQILKTPEISSWLAVVVSVDGVKQGKGAVVLQIADDLILRTWDDVENDETDHTLIDPDSTVFREAAALHAGQQVAVTGTLIRGNQDCYRELSDSLAIAWPAPS